MPCGAFQPAHTWIKRAEVERRRFGADAAKLAGVPAAARTWLGEFREARAAASGALEEYLIRKRAIDGWDKIVQAWAELGPKSTCRQRVAAARTVQANLDDDEKFGDTHLFAGLGDETEECPRLCLADDDAVCVWRTENGKPDSDILKSYVAATVAEHDQRRFKVPAYRHPDPLRHPVYVDYGNSRWGIDYSALKAAGNRRKQSDKLAKAKTERVRQKLAQQLESSPNLREVSLDVWTDERVETLLLRWHGKRLWRDLDLDHFADKTAGKTVARADRLGRVVAGQALNAAVAVAEVFQQRDWNGRLQTPRDQLDRLADIVYGKVNGKRADPDYSKIDRLSDNSKALRHWERLRWFLTTLAKLMPKGPWLDDYVSRLPPGVEYKKGRTGYYLDYAVNKGRKSRARLALARLPKGLRVLSLDLGHRYAAACQVGETISREQMIEECRAAEHSEPTGDELYIHLRWPTNKTQQSGRNKGQPITKTTVYRRIGPDFLDGSSYPAPWFRFECPFLIKLQGEDRQARCAQHDEIDRVNEFRAFLGLVPLADSPRVDDLQRDAVRWARRGLRRLGNAARIAFIMIAERKPVAGGRDSDPLTRQQRVEYVKDGARSLARAGRIR